MVSDLFSVVHRRENDLTPFIPYVSEFPILAHNGGLDCTKTPVFRGDGDLTPKYHLGEVKIKNGKVQPIRGVSLELDAVDAAKHGVLIG